MLVNEDAVRRDFHIALTKIRKERQVELNEAILGGYPDAPSRSEYQLSVQRELRTEEKEWAR